MVTHFYLVRHALKEKGIKAVGISPEGVLQAQMTGKYFSQVPVNNIISSPLLRAKLTAKYISDATLITPHEDIRLRERANWGDLPGQTLQEFVDMWDRCTKDRDYSPPVGDSAKKAGERMSSCLLELSVKHPEESMIIVTHGGLITDFLVNSFSEEVLNQIHPHFIMEQSKLIAECSITKVSCYNGAFELVDFANVAHLE